MVPGHKTDESAFSAQLPTAGRRDPKHLDLFLDSARDDVEAPRPNQTGSCRPNGLRPCFSLGCRSDALQLPYLQ